MPVRRKHHFIIAMGDEGGWLLPQTTVGAPLFAAAGDEAASREIMLMLARHPKARVTVLANNAAQDFRLENLPHLNPVDRHRLVARRLSNAFPPGSLVSSLRFKDGRVLLAGLHDGENLRPWLGLLNSYHPALCLLPVEGADLVSALLPEAAQGWSLLIVRLRCGGFRQIVCHQTRLIFTRLTPAPLAEAPPGEIAASLARDINASLGYLGRLGLTDTRQLDALILLPDAFHDAIAALDLPLHSLQVQAPAQAARQLGLDLKLDPHTPYSDPLFAAHLAQRRKPSLILQRQDLRTERRMRQVGQAALYGATALLVVALVITCMQGWQLARLYLQNNHKAVELAAMDENLQQTQASAAPITQPLGRLRRALERQKLFGETGATPWAVLQAIDQAIDQTARLTRLEWDDYNGNPADAVMQIDLRLPAKSDEPPLTNDTTLAHFRQVAEALAKSLPGYKTELVHLPFPALPQDVVTNNRTDAPPSTPPDNIASLVIRRAP